MTESVPTPLSVLRAIRMQTEIQTQKAILARQVITQIITYPDYTTTAIVTLGPGDPTSVPRPSTPTGGSQDSNGLTSRDIGIIIGSILGAVLLGLLLWVFCIIRRRMLVYEYERGDDIIFPYEVTEIRLPQRAYWPPFPKSIPPPAVPTYVATPRPRMYTANNVNRSSLPTSYLLDVNTSAQLVETRSGKQRATLGSRSSRALITKLDHEDFSLRETEWEKGVVNAF